MIKKPAYEELEKRIQELYQAEFERKREDEVPKESEERLKALSDTSFEAIFLSDKGICLDQNQAAERIFGYTRAEAFGRHGTEWIVPEDRARVKNNMLSGYAELYEATALRKDGTTFPCEIQGRWINYQGRSIRITALRDITKRKRAEKELLKSEEKYRRIIENLQDVYYEAGMDGTILEVSPSIEKISLYKRKELIGKSLYDIYAESKERDEFLELILDKEMVNDFEINLKDKDGSQHSCSITTMLIKDSQGTPIKLIGSMSNISERKQAEEELRESETRYRTLIGAIPDPVVVYDSEGRATYVNDAFVHVFGWSREELIGGRIDFVPPEETEATQEALRSALEDGTVFFETRRCNKNGNLLDIQLKAAILRDQEDKHVLTIVIHRDVTALKQAETALRKAHDELELRVEERTVALAKANEELYDMIAESKQSEEKIRKLNETLELRIAERTAELENRAELLQQLALELSGVEDRQRRHIASILHDHFQQQLSYIKMELDSLRKNTEQKLEQRIGVLAQLTGECIEESRNLSHEIDPPALHHSGLLASLDVLARTMQDRYSLTVKVRAQPGVEPASPTMASILYRSARELLFNVVKHAGVDSAVLDFYEENAMIHLRVEDSGNGFDFDTVRNGQGCDSGFGLYNIENRMTSLGGSLKVRTKPGEKCCVVLTVPTDVSSSICETR